MKIPTTQIYPYSFNWNGVSRRFMNPGELERLITLMLSVKPKRVLEIGVNEGRTAKALLDTVPTIKEYIGVDVPPGYITPCDVQRNEIPQHPGHYAAKDPRFKLHLTPGGSYDLSPSSIGSVDAVFIDGDHSRKAVEHDSALAVSIVRPGGLIVWHDYHDLGTVDVRDVLDKIYEQGADLKHVTSTWLVYEVRPS